MPREEVDEGGSSVHGTPRRCPRAGQTVHSSGRGPDVTTGGFQGEPGELGAGQEEGPRLDSHVWCTGGPRGGGGTTGMGMGLTELTRSGPGFSYGARTAFSLALLKGEETCGSALGFYRLGGAPAPYARAVYLGGRDSAPPRQSAPHPPGPVLTSSRTRGEWPVNGQESDSPGTGFLSPKNKSQDSGEGDERS